MKKKNKIKGIQTALDRAILSPPQERRLQVVGRRDKIVDCRVNGKSHNAVKS